MNRLFFRLNVSVFLVLPLFYCCALAQAYTVSSVDKSAFVKKSNSTTVTLSAGDTINAGQTVEVPAGNVLRIFLDKGGKNEVVAIGRTFLSLRESENILSAEITKGVLYSNIEKMKNIQFQVVTPVAVAAVRGTQFKVTMEGHRALIFNYNGTIEVIPQGAGEPITLNRGEKAAVVIGGTPEKLPMTEQEIEEVHTIFTNTTPRNLQLLPTENKAAEDQEPDEALVVESYTEENAKEN